MGLGDLLHFESYVHSTEARDDLDHNILMLSKLFYKVLLLAKKKKYFLRIKSTKGITKETCIERHHAKKLKGKQQTGK